MASMGGSDLLLEDEVYQIVGCAMEVLNELGHGLHEKPYENGGDAEALASISVHSRFPEDSRVGAQELALV